MSLPFRKIIVEKTVNTSRDSNYAMDILRLIQESPHLLSFDPKTGKILHRGSPIENSNIIEILRKSICKNESIPTPIGLDAIEAEIRNRPSIPPHTPSEHGDSSLSDSSLSDYMSPRHDTSRGSITPIPSRQFPDRPPSDSHGSTPKGHGSITPRPNSSNVSFSSPIPYRNPSPSSARSTPYIWDSFTEAHTGLSDVINILRVILLSPQTLAYSENAQLIFKNVLYPNSCLAKIFQYKLCPESPIPEGLNLVDSAVRDFFTSTFSQPKNRNKKRKNPKLNINSAKRHRPSNSRNKITRKRPASRSATIRRPSVAFKKPRWSAPP